MNVVNYSLLLFTVAPGLLFRIVLIDEMVRLRLLAWSLAFFRLSQYFPRFVQDCLQKIICIKRCTRVRVPRNIAHYLLPWLDLFVLQQTNMIIGELRKFVALWGQSRLEAFGLFLFCEESCAFLCRLFFLLLFGIQLACLLLTNVCLFGLHNTDRLSTYGPLSKWNAGHATWHLCVGGCTVNSEADDILNCKHWHRCVG